MCTVHTVVLSMMSTPTVVLCLSVPVYHDHGRMLLMTYFLFMLGFFCAEINFKHIVLFLLNHYLMYYHGVHTLS
jgi:hypothetical protein